MTEEEIVARVQELGKQYQKDRNEAGCTEGALEAFSCDLAYIEVVLQFSIKKGFLDATPDSVGYEFTE